MEYQWIMNNNARTLWIIFVALLAVGAHLHAEGERFEMHELFAVCACVCVTYAG